MQVIHAASADETLIDEGRYGYFRNDEKMPVHEPWSRHRDSEGIIITRAERDSRVFGNQIQVHSRELDGRMLDFDVVIRLFGSQEAEPEEIRARYAFTREGVSVQRVALDGSVSERQHALDTDCVPSPLMRIYTGAVIQRLLSQGQSQVLVPWIRDPRDHQQLLEPLTSRRQADYQGVEIITVGERTVNAGRYQYSGGEYQPGTLFWLDENDVLLRYIWQQDENTCWDTRLEKYRLVSAT